VLVLAMLAAHPTHGYDLVAALGSRDTGEAAPISRAHIYYSLKKLVRLKLITAVQDATRAAGPEREIFRLSAAGRRAMSKTISRPEWSCERPPIPFQVWLMIVGEAEPEARAAALQLRRKRLAEQIEQQSEAVDRLRPARTPENAMRLAVATHALEVLRLEQQLLAEVEPMLGQRE
jgi:DNA-binding PadR family transcriptional regulator